ncbi:MAG: hypothetical protein ABIP94_11970 [Planctomycetota bacterium]
MELTTAGVVLWTIAVVVAYLSVPLLVVTLSRIREAARQIAGYAETTRTATRGIAANLEPVPALERTEELLGAAAGIAEQLAGGVESVGTELLRRAGGGQ